MAVVDVTASQCNGCSPDETLPILSLSAQFTLELVEGQYFNSGDDELFNGPEWEVTGITGTLNGYAMTLAQAPQGLGSWLNGSVYALGTVYFTADGSLSWLENDNEFNFIETPSTNFEDVITWNVNVVNTPEPSTYAMMIAGIVGLFALFGLARKPQA